MEVQRLVLIHPRELEIPMVKDIYPATSMKALPEDAEKVIQDTKVEKILCQKIKMLLKLLLLMVKIQAKLSKRKNQRTFNFISTIMV